MGRKSKFDSSFKTKVVLDALKKKETLSELAKKYGIAPKQNTSCTTTIKSHTKVLAKLWYLQKFTMSARLRKTIFYKFEF